MTAGLPTALVEALGKVDVDIVRRRVTVGGREVVADSRKQLQAMLATTLYDAWHVGRPRQDGPQPKTTRDRDFEEVLRAVVPHDTFVVAVQPDAETAEAESMVVRLNGVRVRVSTERIVMAGEARVAQLRLPAVLPVMSPGFLMVNGSRGTGLPAAACVRVYLNLATPETAPEVWSAVLNRLEELGVAYRAKVTSSRTLFPRRDGVVVYLGPGSWSAVSDVQKAAAATGGLGGEVSAYVARLDAGVGCAWEPDDPRPGMRGMSFGEHRSHAIAAGLIAAAVTNGTGDRYAAVADALLAARIDPGRTFRNIESPELSHVDF